MAGSDGNEIRHLIVRERLPETLVSGRNSGSLPSRCLQDEASHYVVYDELTYLVPRQERFLTVRDVQGTMATLTDLLLARRNCVSPFAIILHNVVPADFTVNGSKAVAGCWCLIQSRHLGAKHEYDMKTSPRLLYRAKLVKARWKLLLLKPIYMYDLLTAVPPSSTSYVGRLEPISENLSIRRLPGTIKRQNGQS